MQTKQYSPALNESQNARLTRALHIALLILSAVIFITNACFRAIWYDEAFTVGAVSHGMGEMIVGLTYDVHPHLYYILLKLWSYVFGNGVIALRMFSALFGVACVALGYTHIRKDFGDRIGFWFSFIMLFTFSTLKYAEQIRMYTLAVFLLTLTGFYAWRLRNGGGKKDRALFLICSVLSAYTHYFAFFIVAMINAFVLFGAIAGDDRKKTLKSWFFNAFIQFAAYAPGIAVFLFQISLDGADWIRLEFPGVVYDTVTHFFTGYELQERVENGSKIYNIVGIAFTLLFAEIFIKLRFLNRTEREKYRAPYLSFALCAAVFAFTVAVSFYRPIYYCRYAVCFSGFLAFASAFLLANAKKYIKIIVAVALVICFVFSAAPFRRENFSENNVPYTEQIDIREGDLIIIDTVHAFAFTVNFPDNELVFNNLWHWNIGKAYGLLGNNVTISTDISEYDGFTGRIWICGDETIKYFEQRTDVELISEKTVHTDYYNYTFLFRLYEKKA